MPRRTGRGMSPWPKRLEAKETRFGYWHCTLTVHDEVLRAKKSPHIYHCPPLSPPYENIFDAKRKRKRKSHDITQPPPPCPPPEPVDWIAVLHRSSKASFSSSPVMAEHST